MPSANRDTDEIISIKLIAKVYEVDNTWSRISFYIKNSNHDSTNFHLGTIAPYNKDVDDIIKSLKNWEIEDHRGVEK